MTTTSYHGKRWPATPAPTHSPSQPLTLPRDRFPLRAYSVPVTNFSIATNRIWKGQDGEQCKATGRHRVTVWGRLAEVVKTYMDTDKCVRVIGRLEYQS